LKFKGLEVLEELEGELHIVRLDRMPKYDALSYSTYFNEYLPLSLAEFKSSTPMEYRGCGGV
jgi:hypothetical protein